jgi:hypothetical protein
LDVVSVVPVPVSDTVIFAVVELAGTTNLYHTSALAPQLPVPDVVVEVALCSVPAVGVQSEFTVSVVALAQRSFPAWEKDKYDTNNSNAERIKGFFIRVEFY